MSTREILDSPGIGAGGPFGPNWGVMFRWNYWEIHLRFSNLHECGAAAKQARMAREELGKKRVLERGWETRRTPRPLPPRATLFVTIFRYAVQPVHGGRLGIDWRQLLAVKSNAHAALRRSDKVTIVQAAVLRLRGLLSLPHLLLLSPHWTASQPHIKTRPYNQ